MFKQVGSLFHRALLAQGINQASIHLLVLMLTVVGVSWHFIKHLEGLGEESRCGHAAEERSSEVRGEEGSGERGEKRECGIEGEGFERMAKRGGGRRGGGGRESERELGWGTRIETEKAVQLIGVE